MTYKIPSFRYRWFVENCSQIELPNGKVIVIDPMFRKDEASCQSEPEKGFISGFDDSVIERCDYIMLTHVHFDHIGSLRALEERFHAPILVNGWSAYELVKHLNLPTGSVIPMTDGCEYNFDDFRVLWQQGRHTAKVGQLRPQDRLDNGMDAKELEYLHLGTVYNRNFIISLPNGMKIAMDGGRAEPWLNELEKYHPTLILHHASRTAEQCTEEAAAQLTRSGSPYLFMLTMQIMKDPKEMIAAVNEQLAARGVYGRVAYAESGQWIDFAMNAAVE